MTVRSGRNASQAGFTLVEALVSLFVFALIAAGTVTMLMQSVESERRIGLAHEALRGLQTTRAFLANDLAQFTPRDVRGIDNRRLPRFVGGDADRALAFVRANAELAPDTGLETSLAYVVYTLKDDMLVRAVRSDLDPATDETAGERVLLRHVGADAHFEFFDGVVWRNAWISTTAGAPPPRAVALVFSSPRYGDVRFVTLVGLAR